MIKTSRIREIVSLPYAHLIIIIGLGFVIYSNTYGVPFVFDDEPNIQNNPAMTDMRYFTDRRLQDKALIDKKIDEHFRSRIVGYLSFALNYRLHGARVQGYHVFNFLVHLSNAMLLYLLVQLTIKTTWFKKITYDNDDLYAYRIAALFMGLLFISHPVQAQAVTYITQRFTSLATMFCLLSLVFYVKARIEAEAKVKFFSTLTYCLLSVLSVVLAMKTKEIAFTMPLVIALYDVMFFEGKIRKRLLHLAPFLLTMLIVPIDVLGDKNVLSDIKRLEASVQGGQSNMALIYLLTQFRVLVTYLRLLALPVNQNLDYDYPLYHSFLNPPVFLSLLFLAGIFMAGVYLYRRSRKEEIPDRQWLRVTAFGIFWFFITLSVESSLLPLADVINEHRLYLPSAGFFMVIVSAAAMGSRRFGKIGTEAITLFLIFAVLALSIATFQRNKIWKDGLTLSEDTVRKSPAKSRPHNNLGVDYQERGDIDKAIREYKAALAIDADFADGHYNLGLAYQSQGQTDEAVSELLDVLRIKADFADAHYNLGLAYQSQGQTDKAINEYLAQLKIQPDHADAHNNLGLVYRKQGYIDKAIDEYTAALKINPDHAEAHYNIGNAYASKGHFEKAINEFESALKIKPDNADAHNNLGTCYAKRGLLNKAAIEFKEALRLNPNDVGARMNLDILMGKMAKK